MKIGDAVRFYEGEWYSEGRIVEIDNDEVIVDFFDWKQTYKPSELRISYIQYIEVLVPTAPGKTIEDFR